MAMSGKVRQRAYAQRQRDKGLVLVNVWIRSENKDKFKAIAKQLREKQ